MSLDVLFVTDANPRAGFGHLARCLAIAAHLPPGLRIGFQGTLSGDATARIEATMPGACWHAPQEAPRARLAFIDRLAHPDRLDADDPAFIAAVHARVDTLLVLSSGTRPPTLPDGAICIGYQPADVTPAPPSLFWSFDYAPVPAGLVDTPRPPREASRLLVALGGHPDDTLLRKVLGEVSALSAVTDVDVLLSPAMPQGAPPYQVGAHQRLTCHRGVPSVAPLLGRAGAVVASYGNLVYEALALGTPVCAVGQKAFQVALGEALAARDLIVCAGAVDTLTPGALATALEDTFVHAARRAAKGRATIDGEGLARLAKLIQSALTPQEEESR